MLHIFEIKVTQSIMSKLFTGLNFVSKVATEEIAS